MNKRLVWNFEINGDNPLKLPTIGLEETSTERWESRFFWPESAIIVLNGLDDRFLALSQYQAKHRQDTYCLLADKDYNLKIRRNQPLYKPVMMKSRQALAYGKKINLEEEKPSTILPGAHETDTQTLLARIKHESRRIDVGKEALIYRFATLPVLKLELARLHVANATWFSVNIESRSRRLLESVTEQMFGNEMPCDYVKFLKGL